MRLSQAAACEECLWHVYALLPAVKPGLLQEGGEDYPAPGVLGPPLLAIKRLAGQKDSHGDASQIITQ